MARDLHTPLFAHFDGVQDRRDGPAGGDGLCIAFQFGPEARQLRLHLTTGIARDHPRLLGQDHRTFHHRRDHVGRENVFAQFLDYGGVQALQGSSHRVFAPVGHAPAVADVVVMARGPARTAYGVHGAVAEGALDETRQQVLPVAALGADVWLPHDLTAKRALVVGPGALQPRVGGANRASSTIRSSGTSQVVQALAGVT